MAECTYIISQFFDPSIVQGAASQLRGECHEYLPFVGNIPRWQYNKTSVPGALSLPHSLTRGRSSRQRPAPLPTCERQSNTSRLGDRSIPTPLVRKREPLRVSGLFPNPLRFSLRKAPRRLEDLGQLDS